MTSARKSATLSMSRYVSIYLKINDISITFNYTTEMARLSGIQREALKLYRACFRIVKTKPTNTQEHWKTFIRHEFHKHGNVSKKQFSVVEHLIRTGHKRFEMYLNPHIKDVN